jgi:hypothetical protein
MSCCDEDENRMKSQITVPVHSIEEAFNARFRI